MHRHQISPEQAPGYILAGNATVTLVSRATGVRFTYKIRQPDEETPHFVKVLTGSDNEADYQYLGTIFDRETYHHGRRSHIGKDAPSARAWAWFWSRLMADMDLSDVEVWHEGRCGRCGRKLTVPESIITGLGPVCAQAA